MWHSSGRCCDSCIVSAVTPFKSILFAYLVVGVAIHDVAAPVKMGALAMLKLVASLDFERDTLGL